jgi:hypothetical protein
MSNFEDIVAVAEKEAKKKLDEYKAIREADLKSKEDQAVLDKRIADRELELKREQYLKDKFSSDPDKYIKAMVANSISTKTSLDELITDSIFKKPQNVISNNTNTSSLKPEIGTSTDDHISIKWVLISMGIILLMSVFVSIVNKKDERISKLIKEKENVEYSLSKMEQKLTEVQADIIIVNSAEDAYYYSMGKIAIVCGQIVYKSGDIFLLKGNKDTTRRIFVSVRELLQKKEYKDWFTKISEVGNVVCVTGKVYNDSNDNPRLSIFNPIQVITIK